jgi:hypothetical protein
MKRKRTRMAALALVAGVGACAATTGTPPVAPQNGGEQPNETSTAQDSGDPAALAMKTLSRHISVPMKEVRVVSITPMEWRDSSLGCPKPDRGYMQVITPGHMAVLEHGGREYSVHVAGKRALVCEPVAAKGEKIGALPPLTILSPEDLQQRARADLAGRLGVSEDEIKVRRSHVVEWPDSSLGCPKPNEQYVLQRTKGYLLELEYRGRTFPYHSDHRRVIPCPDIDRS